MNFITGLDFPEGPVVLPDRSWLVVEMGAESGCVTYISPEGKTKRRIARTGRPNGLVFDQKGYLWVAESLRPALLRMDMKGRYEEWVSECNGLPFIFPNDLAFGPDGLLYMTDSGIKVEEFAPGEKINPDYASLKYDGRVYQIDTVTRQVQLIDRGLLFTNGIAFGPDNNLYVNETLGGNVYRYDRKESGFGPRQYFSNVVDPLAPAGWKGPDGMKFGMDGNLYVTVFAQGDVTVLNVDGKVVNRIKTEGSKPTNLVFGADGEKKIYVTEIEKGNLEIHDVETEGYPLYFGGITVG
jgi:gluconolactonase